MSNDKKTTISIPEEQKTFLELIKHEDAATSLSGAVQWCIDACMRIEKMYGVDACHVAWHDIRKEIQETEAPAAQPMEENINDPETPDERNYRKLSEWYLKQMRQCQEENRRLKQRITETPAPGEKETWRGAANPEVEPQYKTGDIPADHEERIKRETDQYINLHYTNESVRTAVYWGCVAAARREYLLARRATEKPSTEPVPILQGEVPEEVNNWMIENNPYRNYPEYFNTWDNGATAMYHRDQEQIKALIEDGLVWNRKYVEEVNKNKTLQSQLEESRHDTAAFKEWWQKVKNEIADYRKALEMAELEITAMYKRIGINGSNILDLINNTLNKFKP